MTAPASSSSKSDSSTANKNAAAAPKFEIQLERSNKVYYPGETIHGTVVMTLPHDVHNCSVHVDLTSKAQTSWSIGGDITVVDGNKVETPRTDYSGTTLFQNQSQTIFGHVYQTGTVPTPDAKEGNFDTTPGLGVIYIPCQKSATLTTEEGGSGMRLKIEAFQSTAIMDVTKLAEKGSKELYYLRSTLGKMQKGSVQMSASFAEYTDVFPHYATTTNATTYDTCLILRIHRVRDLPKGTTDVAVTVYDWTHGPKATMKEYDTSHLQTTLSAGVHTFPFRVTLKEDAPGSAHWKIGTDTASILYSIKAYIMETTKTTPQPDAASSSLGTSTPTMFTVLANRPLPRPALISPYKMATGDQPMHSFRCCLPRNNNTIKYTVSISMHLGRLAYGAGEMIDMTGSTVINNSSTPQRAQIVLCSYLQMTDTNNQQKHSLRDHQVFFETEIPAHETVILTNLQEYNGIRVPAVYPSYAGLYLDATQKHRYEACVKWAYTLEIRLPDWGSGFYCRTPFLICAAPPLVSQLQEYRNVKADPLLTGQYSIFEHAVSGVVTPCATAPTLTSPKGDKGRQVLVRDAQPIWMGCPEDYEIWMRDESNCKRLNQWMESKQQDADYSDLMKLFYRTMVNVYSGPSGTFDVSYH